MSKQDLVGRVYEYFLGKFAATEGKGGGEFYNPKCMVTLIAEMIEPYKGKIYDPCCGSGGIFVQSIKFVDSHKGNRKDISFYGQKYTSTTYKLAKMNLAIRGIAANFVEVAGDTFFKDQHPDLKADFIMANPPHEGKQDLDKSIPIKLKHWNVPNSWFVVVRDKDQSDCVQLKQRLKQLCEANGRPETLIRIGVHELESWFLGGQL